MFDFFETYIRLLNVGLPEGSAGLGLLIFGLLTAAAAVDAVRARVPDGLILLGFLALLATVGVEQSWVAAAMRLLAGFIAGFILYAANEIWFRLFRRDAIGMGDAKWTSLVVATYPLHYAIGAWIVGAWIAVLLLVFLHIACRIAGQRGPGMLAFVPFLWTGFVATLIEEKHPFILSWMKGVWGFV